MLIAIRPFQGHLEPLVPIARALRDAQHEVTFATEEGFCGVVERCGFTAKPAGLDPFAPSPPHHHEFSEGATRAKLDGILSIAASMGSSTGGPWTESSFDLILRDPTDLAAVIAAEELGVPHVTIGFARYIPPYWWRRVLGSSLDTIRSDLGLAPDPSFQRLHRWLYIDTVPPWLQTINDPLPRRFHRVRQEAFQVPHGAGGTRAYPAAAPIDPGAPARPIDLASPSQPPDLASPSQPPDLPSPSRPLVLVTMGTVFNRRPKLISSLCRGALKAGARVLCTLGPRLDASELDIPDGDDAYGTDLDIDAIQTTSYTPIGPLLPSCAVVVCHGGYNTVLAALQGGVPLIVVPLGADNDFNARRCEELSVGVRRPPESISEATIAELVSRVLAQPGYRTAAQRLAGMTERLPPVASAVPLLERLAAKHRVSLRV